MPPDSTPPDDLSAYLPYSDDPDDGDVPPSFSADGAEAQGFDEGDEDSPFLQEDDDFREELDEAGALEAPFGEAHWDEADEGRSHREAIEEALDQAQARFAVAGVLDQAPPEVRVRGEAIGWPLSPEGRARLRELASLSWFGGDELTRFDPEVRSARELPPAQLEITGLEPVVAAALREMEQALGEGPLRADLDKLLHYEPGDHFRPHRDGAKTDDMVGTLILGLPGRHSGGELRVSLCGDELRSRLTSTAARTSFVGFYADCLHELRPVEEGYRSCLSLIVRRAAPSAFEPRSAPAALVEAVEAWANDPAQPPELVLPLLHRYPQKPPAPADLRGRDREAVAALLATARIAGVEASLATMQVRADRHDQERWSVELSGHAPHPELLPAGALLRPWMLAFLEPSFGECYTGNESEFYYLSYRNAALVLRKTPSAEAPWHDDDRGFEQRALSSLLERARQRRWRSLDLGWLFEPELSPGQVRLLTELAPHLEELRCRAGRWLSWLTACRALTRLEIDARERLNSRPLRPGDLPPALVGRLRSFTLINDRRRVSTAEKTMLRDAIEALDDATELRHLELHNCLLLALPPGLSRAPLRTVRILELSAQFELPPWFGADGGLEELTLEDARGVAEIPPLALGERLRVLDLRSVGVRRLDLRGATGLRRLTLGPGPLAAPPEGLEALAGLECLSLNFPGVRRSSPWDVPSLAALRSLRNLELHLTPPARLPPLPASRRLERLILDDNGLTALPPELPALTGLRALSAEKNEISGLPDLSPLRRLLSLRLAHNPLASLEGLASLTTLEELDLYCACVALPATPLPALRSLRFIDQRDASCAFPVPPWVMRLTELRRLWLPTSEATLASLATCSLPALEELCLGYDVAAPPGARHAFPALTGLPRGCTVQVIPGLFPDEDLRALGRRLEETQGLRLVGPEDEG